MLVFAGLHLLTLWALGVAQPLFDLLGDNATFFVARDSRPHDIVVFALALTLVGPAVMFALETLAWWAGPSVRRPLHLVFVALLAAIIVLQVLKRLADGAPSTVLIALALGFGVGAALAYRALAPVRTFVTVLSPAPVVFAVLFLVVSPVSAIVFPDDGDVRLADVDGRAPVVMIVFDEFPVSSIMQPDERIDAERYPNFARLARDATWFRRTSSVHPQTEYAIPSILTGRWPRGGALPIAADHPRNVFTLLGRGYEVNATESLTRLCPSDLCRRESKGAGPRLRSLASDAWTVSLHLLLPEDLRERLPSISGTWQGFGDGLGVPVRAPAVGREAARTGHQTRVLGAFRERDRAGIVNRFVASVARPRARTRPRFDFMHVLLPHTPWQYLPSGRRYGNSETGFGGDARWSRDRWAAWTGYQRYLLNVGYVDRVIGDVVRRLRAAGLYDRSLVVVTADHGASFRAGQSFRSVAPATEADLAFVPLFVKGPGQRRGRVVDAAAQTVDVLPTIADLLDIEIPWRVDGRSLMRMRSRNDTVAIYSPIVAERREYPLRRLEIGLRATLRRQAKLFGTGDPARLYASGPRAELLGRSSAALPRDAGGALAATIDDASLLADVQPATGFVPAHVTGELRGRGADRAHDLAVAVNGRIAAVARSAPGDPSRYSAMVPESALRRGPNAVEVFAVSPGSDALALLARTESGYALVRGGLRTSAGRRLPLARREFDGFLEDMVDRGEEVRVTGWAARRSRAVERVLLFDRGRFVGAVRPRVPRPGVTERLGRPDLYGFSTTLPYYALQGARTRLSAFALADGRVARLSPICGKARRLAGCR